MNDIQLSWLAGIIDMKADITFLKRKYGRRTYYNSTCHIRNKKQRVLEEIKAIVRLGKIREANVRVYTLTLSVEEQKRLYPLINPFLVIKRKQVELINEYFSLSTDREGSELPDSIVNRRVEIYEMFTRLS